MQKKKFEKRKEKLFSAIGGMVVQKKKIFFRYFLGYFVSVGYYGGGNRLGRRSGFPFIS
jgi:hypothetical protein